MCVLLNLIFSVVFRMVVFRPFASEVIVAKVKSSDQESIRRASAHRLCFISLISPDPHSNCRILRRHLHPCFVSAPTQRLVRPVNSLARNLI